MASQGSAYSYLQPRQRGFWFVFVGSIALHGLLIAAFAFAQGKRRPVIDLTENAIQTKLVKLGKKREPKLLPRKTRAPAPKPVEKQLATEAEPVPEPEPRQDKMQEALQKIEDDAARKRQRDEALRRIADQVGDVEDEEGDPEGSRHGTATSAQSLTLTQAYFARLHDRIKDFYSVPSIISVAERRRLEAILVVFIGPDGTLLRHEIEKSSGNDAFDSALEAAVSRASPLPAPPAFLRETLRDGIGLRFRP